MGVICRCYLGDQVCDGVNWETIINRCYLGDQHVWVYTVQSWSYTASHNVPAQERKDSYLCNLTNYATNLKEDFNNNSCHDIEDV